MNRFTETDAPGLPHAYTLTLTPKESVLLHLYVGSASGEAATRAPMVRMLADRLAIEVWRSADTRLCEKMIAFAKAIPEEEFGP